MIKLNWNKTVWRHLDHVKLQMEKAEQSQANDLMFSAMEHGDEAAEDGTSNTDTDPNSDSEVRRSSRTSRLPERYRPVWS